MTDIVFINSSMSKQEPFTTSEIIAEYTNVQHHAIKQIIAKHKNDLKEFGIMAFDVPKIEGRGRPKTNYRLNEQQATLVITYLQNTAPVRAFKKELVRQFYLTRAELMKRQQIRAELKPLRRDLTNAIRDRSDLNQWAYKAFTDLAYKCAVGKTAAQIKKDRGADLKAPAVSFMTAAELEEISRVSNQIAVLVDLGMDYREIKAAIKKKALTE